MKFSFAACNLGLRIVFQELSRFPVPCTRVMPVRGPRRNPTHGGARPPRRSVQGVGRERADWTAREVLSLVSKDACYLRQRKYFFAGFKSARDWQFRVRLPDDPESLG